MIWAAEGRLAPGAHEVIERAGEAVYVSAATVWEIEIKRALGRLRAPEDVLALVDESGFERLAITLEHARAAGQLPPHHADPFDRMLIAQGQLEGLTLATADASLGRYGIPLLELARA